MSLYKKIQSGEKISSDDWVEYLIQSHTKMPGMTEFCFENFKTNFGCNTYDLILRDVKLDQNPSSVLDLACGDGPLLKYIRKNYGNHIKYQGVDMVHSEIERAKSIYIHDNNATFKCEKAQALSAEANSIDIVFCHLALMLMLPLEPVLNEIFRVLKPGGQFVSIIGKKNDQGGMFAVMGSEAVSFIQQQLAKANNLKTGDSRLGTKTGVESLLRSSKFSGVESIQDAEMLIKGKPNDIWNALQHFYIIGMLSVKAQKRLKEIAYDKFEEDIKSKGSICASIPLMLIKANKAPDA